MSLTEAAEAIGEAETERFNACGRPSFADLRASAAANDAPRALERSIMKLKWNLASFRCTCTRHNEEARRFRDALLLDIRP